MSQPCSEPRGESLVQALRGSQFPMDLGGGDLKLLDTSLSPLLVQLHLSAKEVGRLPFSPPTPVSLGH